MPASDWLAGIGQGLETFGSLSYDQLRRKQEEEERRREKEQRRLEIEQERQDRREAETRQRGYHVEDRDLQNTADVRRETMAVADKQAAARGREIAKDQERRLAEEAIAQLPPDQQARARIALGLKPVGVNLADLTAPDDPLEPIDTVDERGRPIRTYKRKSTLEGQTYKKYERPDKPEKPDADPLVRVETIDPETGKTVTKFMRQSEALGKSFPKPPPPRTTNPFIDQFDEEIDEPPGPDLSTIVKPPPKPPTPRGTPAPARPSFFDAKAGMGDLTSVVRPPATPVSPAADTAPAGLTVGAVLSIGGKRIRVTKVYPDGTFDGEEIK
jgi:hypothetical protein